MRLLAAAVLLAGSMLALGVGPGENEARSMPVLVGHRGSHMGVESSVEALETGARMGFSFIESDLRVAADGALILSHDTDTRRLGTGLVVDSTAGAALLADTLRQERYGRKFTGHIASLRQMLDICRRHDVRPLIELKWARGINSKDCSGIPALIDTLIAENMLGKCMILTSMKPCLEYIAERWPEVSLQLLVQQNVGDENLEFCRRHPGMGIDMHRNACTPEVVERYHAAGIPVNVWSVNDPLEARKLADMGVDYLTTDSLTVF